MGELIDLQAYREKKLTQEVDALFQELDDLNAGIEDCKPYWPLDSGFNVGGGFCSISYTTLPYYSDDNYFTENDLWLWLKGDHDEEPNTSEGIFGEDE